MNSFDFREDMIKKVRAFEKWAYKDQQENPEDYENISFDEWFRRFEEYVN